MANQQQGGSFSTLSPSSAALVAPHLQNSQNSLLKAAMDKREHAEQVIGITSDINEELSFHIKKSIMMEAEKQITQGSFAIAGGGVALAGAGAGAYYNREANKKIEPLTKDRNDAQALVDNLHSKGNAADMTIGSSANAAIGDTKSAAMIRIRQWEEGNRDPVKTVEPTLSGGATTRFKVYDEKTPGVKGLPHKMDATSDEAVGILNAPEFSSTPIGQTARANVLRKTDADIKDYNTRINSETNTMHQKTLTINMVKDGARGFLDGTSAILCGEIDAKRALHEEAKAQLSYAKDMMDTDKRMFTEYASKYQTDGTKSLDLINQVRNNNRYQ